MTGDIETVLNRIREAADAPRCSVCGAAIAGAARGGICCIGEKLFCSPCSEPAVRDALAYYRWPGPNGPAKAVKP